MIGIKNSRGVTYVEVVVAALLVMVVVIALVAAIAQSSVFSKRLDMIYNSSYLVQRRVEMLKRFDFAQLGTTTETDVRIDIDGNIDPIGAYRRTTEVDANYLNNPSLTKVKVTVGRVDIGTGGGAGGFVGTPIVVETLIADVDDLT